MPDRQGAQAWNGWSWFAVSPGLALAALGILIVAAPRMGAALFGLPAPEGEAIGYLHALGIRDIAFGGYVLALAALSGRRAAGIVLAVTVLIPVSDMVLLVAMRGLSSPLHLLLHGASGVYIGTGALILLRQAARRR
ncbi:DUF4267 domain-containing protein [Roseomonas sp. SSH11]|uniref:DUF4267 domain-containing protein n=1 Tax=Pararoseomonas baculiformis TaxID=2820812 RepID=A0ABS4AEB9_9PROT|nr:DUF4267 domain-containing protein [Pararoseomonas baculiformis]MBP0445356.1 DUF4267 domain-containing protein [Pararoseomonas baculiformis]